VRFEVMRSIARTGLNVVADGLALVLGLAVGVADGVALEVGGVAGVLLAGAAGSRAGSRSGGDGGRAGAGTGAGRGERTDTVAALAAFIADAGDFVSLIEDHKLFAPEASLLAFALGDDPVESEDADTTEFSANKLLLNSGFETDNVLGVELEAPLLPGNGGGAAFLLLVVAEGHILGTLLIELELVL
jgi:hypothetical protein